MTENDSRISQRQRLRLQRLHMAMIAWAISIVLAIYAWSLDLLDMSVVELGVLVLLVLATHLTFHITIRSGWNRRLRDPSLTLPQILAATILALWVISHAHEARTILLMLFIVTIFFGVFRLRTAQFLLVAGLAIAGYIFIVLNDLATGEMARSKQLMALELGVFATVMIWLAFIGSHVAELRRKLAERNRELEQASQHLQHMADHDELTGLPNRRQLLGRLEVLRTAALEHGRTFSVAVLDLDLFKRINDRYGHLVGDQVLTRFAEITADELRGSDEVARIDETTPGIGRIGGEEFLAILPGTDCDGARLAAERVRQRIAETTVETEQGPVHFTVSAGVTEHIVGEALHHTLGRADEALYRAKEGGRNRVVVAPGQ